MSKNPLNYKLWNISRRAGERVYSITGEKSYNYQKCNNCSGSNYYRNIPPYVVKRRVERLAAGICNANEQIVLDFVRGRGGSGQAWGGG
jgi:hypothetical protein